jgi:hypothetical protein
MNRSHRQIGPGLGVNHSHSTLGESNSPCRVSTFSSTKGAGDEAAI